MSPQREPLRDPSWPAYCTERARRDAHQAVARAIENGRLDPPTDHPCLDCGARYPSCLIEYHHCAGYARARWLTVVALCRRCHARAHLRLEPPLEPPLRGTRAAEWDEGVRQALAEDSPF
jgi:hypothetical protein